MKLATYSNSTLELTTGAAIIVAIIAAAPFVAVALLDRLWMTKGQQATIELEMSKLELERRKAAVVLFQAALSNPDSAQRRQVLQFLTVARVVDDTSAVARLSSELIPHWRAVAASPP